MIAAAQGRLAPCIVAAATLLWCAAGGAATFHVDPVGGDDGADGLGWTTAFRTLERALAAAEVSPGRDEILLAEGSYPGEWRLQSSVVIKGGFPIGGGIQDPDAHRSTLEGDPFGLLLVLLLAGSEGSELDGLFLRKAQIALQASASDLILSRLDVSQASEVRLDGDGIRLRESALHGLRLHVRGTSAFLEDVLLDGPNAAALRVSADGVTLRDVRLVGLGRAFCPEPPQPIPLTPFSPLSLDGRGVTLENVIVVEHPCLWDPAVRVREGSEVQASNLTVARNQGPAVSVETGGALVLIRDSVFSENGLGLGFWGEVPGGHVQDGLDVTHSLVQGGYPGTGNIDDDPLFLAGPMGAYYLSQTAAGQPTDSPALDAGSRLASDAGLDLRTTRADSVGDSGVVDMGYHFPAVGDLEILRGTEAGVLQPHGTVQSLPFRDDPGSLTDPLTPLLFYEIPVATQPIRLEKDLDEERVILRF